MYVCVYKDICVSRYKWASARVHKCADMTVCVYKDICSLDINRLIRTVPQQ